jgi:hypothetical protein
MLLRINSKTEAPETNPKVWPTCMQSKNQIGRYVIQVNTIMIALAFCYMYTSNIHQESYQLC